MMISFARGVLVMMGSIPLLRMDSAGFGRYYDLGERYDFGRYYDFAGV